MIRLAALGALGYFGYKYLQRNVGHGQERRESGIPSDAVAGGPISDEATVQHTPELPA